MRLLLSRCSSTVAGFRDGRWPLQSRWRTREHGASATYPLHDGTHKSKGQAMADPLRKLRPFELARWQLDRDQDRMRRMAVLLSRKQSKMSVSPFAFLRGSAPLFYRVLANAPRLAHGPDEDGMLCGDLHLENFGVYRPDKPSRVGDR